MTDYAIRAQCEAARRDGSRCTQRALWMTHTGWLCTKHRDQCLRFDRTRIKPRYITKRFPRRFLP
jgi:hypothetical protein